LPSAMIVIVPHFAKYVAWDGETYSFHATKQGIIADDSLMFIGRIKREADKKAQKVRAPAEPPRNELKERSTGKTTPKKYPRFPSSIHSPSAAQKMESHMKSKGLNQTEFAIQAGTTDKTIRKFRQTGKIKRSILVDIAKAMCTTKEELLK